MTSLFTPVISVIMPVYNGAQFLREAIDSILNQSFNNFELIILNDGSTDGSREIVLSYSDQRIRFADNEVNGGISNAINQGVSLSRGKYIARMDGDDISAPDRLQKQFDYMEARHDIVVCGGFFTPFRAGKSVPSFNWVNETDSEFVKINLLFDCAICHPTVIIRAEALKESGLIFESKYDSAEDYRMWISIAKQYKLANIPDHVLMYRLSSNQISNRNNRIQRALKFELIKDQLQTLGITPTDVEMRIHEHMYYADPIVSYDYFPKMKAWMNKLKTANNIYNVYDQAKFSAYLTALYDKNKANLGVKTKSLSLKSIADLHIKKALRWKSIR